MDAAAPARPSRRHVVRLAVAAAIGVGTVPAFAGVAQAAPSQGTWERLAKCESSGNWRINSGNGFYGGLQFTRSTWKAFGGSGMPHHASRAEQIRVARKVLAKQGWGAWPACSKKLGLRR
jgi:hypothetical protein